MSEELENLGDDIYNSLKDIESEEQTKLDNRAFIADTLSEKLLALGYHKSHPSPTPDLLLTDEEITIFMTKFGWIVIPSDNPELDKSKLVDLKYQFLEVAKAQLSKLQQARPTTEVREKIDDIVARIPRVCAHNAPACKFYEYSKCEKPDLKVCRYQKAFADQFIALLPFPDEQGIRESERKAIGEFLDYGYPLDKMIFSLLAGKLPQVAILKDSEPPQENQ